MDFVFRAAIKTLILPPAINLWLMLFGVMLISRHPRWGKGLFVLGLVSLLVLSMPIIAFHFRQSVEEYPPLSLADAAKAEAIVVLGSGRYRQAPEYYADTVNAHGLMRLRYAAHLARQFSLPILTTGGTPFGDAVSEATLMADVLMREFAVEVFWLEGKSRNTAENAEFSAAMLKAEGVERVILVTHATHMARAVDLFAKTGLTIYPASTAYTTPLADSAKFLYYLPNIKALQTNTEVLHEYLGILWYRLKGLLDNPAHEKSLAQSSPSSPL